MAQQSIGDAVTQGGSIGDASTMAGPRPAAPAGSAADSIGAYVIHNELGQGTYGIVYKAFHPEAPDSPVALKVLHAQGKPDHLLLEPALLAKLDHPCIVRVLDYFAHADGQQIVIALEYIDGGDLKTAIDETERFPPEIVLDLLVQIGGALAEAHGKGIVHRDLKPANILIDRTGSRVRYVLADFGVGGADEGIRSDKKLAGTWLFMAPEQLRGRPGPQSDLWALGVTAYRMLTGRFPFAGDSVPELVKQIQLTTPSQPSAVIGQAIDARLERAIMKLLDRSETERIGSALELLNELGQSGDTRKLLSTTTITTASRVGKRMQSLEESLGRGIRRNYRWLIFWLVLYVLLAGVQDSLPRLAGLALFYDAYRRFTGWRKSIRIFAAFGLLLLPFAITELFGGSAPKASPNLYGGSLGVQLFTRYAPLWASGLLPVFVLSMLTLTFFAPVLACNSYAKANRLRRERLLLTAAGASPEEYLARLRHELEYRYEDVNFHLRYAEALASRGDDRGAAIEARLMLDQDPYHFTGNLLLAQSYLRLGLTDLCERVCDDYLAVSGYCFEFAELREQYRRRKAGAA